MMQVTFKFPNKQSRDNFISWFSNSGEQDYMECSEDHDDDPINNINYKRAFPAWGYKPKVHGPPVVECEVIEE